VFARAAEGAAAAKPAREIRKGSTTAVLKSIVGV
jgi:hypothetical protein